MRALGLSPDDYGDEDAIEIWPENIQSVNFFLEYCPSQWQHGFNGPTGLNYPSVKLCIGDEESDPDKAKELFWCVRRIERGALDAMAERRRKEEADRQ